MFKKGKLLDPLSSSLPTLLENQRPCVNRIRGGTVPGYRTRFLLYKLGNFRPI